MIKKARELLYEEYNYNRIKIRLGDEQNVYFVDEKIKHSQQVLGAGNYIVKHEPCFQNRENNFIEHAKVAALLHDVARFREGVYRSYNPGKAFNHSFEGADILAKIPEFNFPEIVLAVKYHGMRYIYPLYKDCDFIKLTDSQKNDVDMVAKMVRDADKIANFYLIIKNKKHMEKLIFAGLDENVSDFLCPNEKIIKSFMNEELFLTDDIISKSDRILAFIAWIFDLNYNASIKYCMKLNIFAKLFDYFNCYCKDVQIQDAIANKIISYINNAYGINIKG